jgi:hypothetical protein
LGHRPRTRSPRPRHSRANRHAPVKDCAFVRIDIVYASSAASDSLSPVLPRADADEFYFAVYSGYNASVGDICVNVRLRTTRGTHPQLSASPHC